MKLGHAISAGLVTVVLFTGALGASISANAAMIKTNDNNSVKVDVRGLDLSSQRGQEVLYHRLQNAAKKICGSSSVREVGSLVRALDNKSCYNETLSNSVEALGSESLEQIHETS